MRVNFNVSGGDDLAKTLQSLPALVSLKVQREALKSGAEPIREAASALAPRDQNANAPHLADNIVISVPSKSVVDAEGLFDQAVVEVGPSIPHFYGYFGEFGTAKEQARPWFRPAFDSTVGLALNIVRAEAWAAIRKGLTLGGRSTTGRGL